MKVIMLMGTPESGKTTTLNMVYDELAKSGATVISNKSQLGKDPQDFKCILQYQGKRVGIFTMGDYYEEIIYALGYFEGMGCDVLIIANSNKSKPRDRVAADPANVIIDKTMPLSNASNTADMHKIIHNI